MKTIIALLASILLCSSTAQRVIGPDLKSNETSTICGSGNQTFYNHTPFSYIIEEDSLCSGEVFILNYVQSSSDHFDRRMLIRETWGSVRYIDTDPVRLLFIVGRPKSVSIQMKIEDESHRYRDIVQADFQDSYRNLTLKHIVALHWVHTFCSQAKFISKTDDDTFINVFALHEYVRGYLDYQKPIILGQISDDEYAIRKVGNKWMVTKDMYQPEKYPPFTKGFAYVISQSAIRPLLICSYYERFLFIDDVFITGLVVQKSNVTLVNYANNYGFRILGFYEITEEIMNNIFFVGNNKVMSSEWLLLWTHSVKEMI